jgi:hypothetical protein
VVVIPVDFDDKGSSRRTKIHDRVAKHDLATKDDAELASPKAAPESGLARRRMKAKEVCALLEQYLPRETGGAKRNSGVKR